MAKNEVAVTDGDGIDTSTDISVTKTSPLALLQNGDVLRSVIIILCLAIFLVVGVILIYWAREPAMRPLGNYSDNNELNAVMSYLQQHKYEYKFYELRSEEHTSELQSPDHLVC